MANHPSPLGEKLQNLRIEAGLTQQQLATTAQISLSTVSKLEEGAVTRPSAKILLKITTVLKCDLDWLLSAEPLPKAKRSKRVHPQIKSPISFVYFDIGGVLAHTESLLLQHLSIVLHRPLDAVRAVYYRYIVLVHRGKLSMEDLQYLMLLKLNVHFRGQTKQHLFRNWLDFEEPNSPAHAFAKELAAKYPLGLISNIPADTLAGMFKRGLVPSLSYKVKVESHASGFIKPETQLFDLATEAAGVPPGKILLIDDRKENVVGARQFGWQAAWFNESKAEASIERIRRDYL